MANPGWRFWLVALTMCGAFAPTREARAETVETVVVRGHAQLLHVYGSRGGVPVIVSGGDGGWIRLAPHIARALAARGFFVVGFDVKAYLASFTSGRVTLSLEDEPGDYRALVDFAARGSNRKPVLVGTSEGAGLSVLAAADPRTKRSIAGVVGLGLPQLNELGWRWKDAVIYLTHGVPSEPTFDTAAIIDRVSPVPLAVIHSTQDEFEAAGEPKAQWIVRASNHNFSDNLAELDRRVLDAIAWVTDHATP
jgi:type IV secretory pathway VirJ component